MAAKKTGEKKETGTKKSTGRVSSSKKTPAKKSSVEKKSPSPRKSSKVKASSTKKTTRSTTSRGKQKVRLNKKSVLLSVVVIALCLGALLWTNYVLSKKDVNPESHDMESTLVQDETPVEEKLDGDKTDSGQNKNDTANVPEKKVDKTVKLPSPVVQTLEDEVEELEIVPEDEANPEPVQNDLSQMIPLAKNGAKLCFVFDDAGLNVANVRQYTSLPFPLTVAVLPRLSKSRECAKTVVDSGKEVILHQPMQAHDYPSGASPNPGEGAILPDMDSETVAATIKDNIQNLGVKIKGMNNHEGSLVTESEKSMAYVFDALDGQGLYFLDSRTSSKSVVQSVGNDKGFRTFARRAPFLDNEIDGDKMFHQILKGLDVANENGYAIMIGHVDKSVKILPDLLGRLYPILVKKGYGFSSVSDLA